MNTVNIQLYGKFKIILDGRELDLAPSIKETLALLVVAGGNRLTAKGLWKILYKCMGIKYSTIFFFTRIKDLQAVLEHFDITDLLLCSSNGMRSCRLNLNVVRCDYYEMLDGKQPFGNETEFLPEYEWAKGFYQKDWSSLHDYYNRRKL